VPPARVPVATALQTDGPDVVLDGASLHKALGYVLGGDAESARGTRLTAFGHFGWGGQQGFADPGVGLAVGVTKATMGGLPMVPVVRRLRDALGPPS
jgi:hypothetical protein